MTTRSATTEASEQAAQAPAPARVHIGPVRRRTDPVRLTEPAATKVRELLRDEPAGTRLRVEVRPGGCSGYSYELVFDAEDIDLADDRVSSFAGVEVVVDRESAALLAGSTLDYRDGLQGAGFHLANPNATRTCGCGQSFS